MWFPIPHQPDGLEIIGEREGVSPCSLFELLHNPNAVEWKEKVGVAAPADGSAKTTARLLQSGKWVFKTDLSRKANDKTALRNWLQQLADLAVWAEFWHPEKVWFLMKEGQGWLPMSVCPRLTTIRSVGEWDARIRWWTRMIVMGLEISKEHSIGLDLNPSNFAFDDPFSDKLYYLDDEFYTQHDCFDIAEAVVSRIPEEPTVSSEKWRQWGVQLQGAVQPFCQKQGNWRYFLDGIRHYPLPEAMKTQRNALIEGLEGQTDSPSSSRDVGIQRQSLQYKMTCIFSDVHANLPAFEAVLKEAAKMDVDSYLFLGDIVSYGPFPRQCIERLAELQHIECIRGNHDHTAGSGIPEDGSNRMAREVDMWTHNQLTQAEREWLLALPVEHLSAPWLAVHGAPQDPNRFYAYVYELTYGDNLSYLERHHFSVCFYGHTHVQFVYRRLANGKDEKARLNVLTLFRPQERMLINPGSVGQPRDGDPRAAFALWNREKNEVTFHRVSYPIAITVNAIMKEGLPEDFIYRLEVGR
ncbi:hypothetical protein CSA56_12305 [candidate division KSB3 bacterium]|uniref:Calcineurin-like phosphoesterase domain-containing protein n=1 Tax=candidate division KSB3 bacterium TaxID=2044937 RepID=A0A2G6KCC5_9BACT|nr:MAG: hypothetical protein CSA56_12305 [candidate division KSB3 bacterium]